MSDTPPLPTAFREDLRYEGYDLTPESLVVDCGGFEGRFSSEIATRYGCKVIVFEPIARFRAQLVHATAHLSNVHVIGWAVGSRNRTEEWHIKGDMTGAFNGEGDLETVEVINFCEWLSAYQPIDLLKLNIEGMEYELVDELIATQAIKRVRNLQVQFHRKDAESEMIYGALSALLAETHHLTYHFPFCWENWRLNQP